MNDVSTKHWVEMTVAEQRRAIRRLHADGMGVFDIADACGLTVQAVRMVIAGDSEVSTTDNVGVVHIADWRHR